MSPGADQYRLAVAVFDDPSSLWNAIRALLRDGMSFDQLCLVALASTMESLRPPVLEDGTEGPLFASLLAEFTDFPGTSGGHGVVATKGLLLDSMLHVRGSGSHADRRDVRAALAHRPELDEQVRQGAITLIARSATPAQQSLTTRTLLSQSTHSVKTFEFTLGLDGSGTPGL